MEERFIQQLKKGVLDMVVLQLVAQRNTYGYEMLQQLEEESNGCFTLKEGTLYPILYRLEDNKLIQSAWQLSKGKKTPKKYYSITDKGKEVLKEYEMIWKNFKVCVDYFCKGEN